MTSPVGNSTRTYDGFGRMMSVVGNDGVNRILVYSQSGQMLYVTVTGNPLAAGTKYVYLHNHVVAEVGGGVQYDHTDGLGSPIAATDGTRAVISRTRYEPYGQIQSGPAGTFGFTGHLNAADLGLVYMQQRYYDPVAGRFLSIDPVTTDAKTGGSFNRYAYANNSPYRYIDPDGRDPNEAHGPLLFRLTTIESAKKGVTQDQAVQNGAVAREAVGKPLITIVDTLREHAGDIVTVIGSIRGVGKGVIVDPVVGHVGRVVVSGRGGMPCSSQ